MRQIAILLTMFMLLGCGSNGFKANNRGKDANEQGEVAPTPPSLLGKWYEKKCHPYLNNRGFIRTAYWVGGYLFRNNGTGSSYIKYYKDSECRDPFPESDPINLTSPTEYSIGKNIRFDVWELNIKELSGTYYMAYAIREDEFHMSVYCSDSYVQRGLCSRVAGTDPEHRATDLVDQYRRVD